MKKQKKSNSKLKWMADNKVLYFLSSRRRDDCPSIEELEKLSIKELESMAMKFPREIMLRISDTALYGETDVLVLRRILEARKAKLNKGFQWTEENAIKLSELNGRIISVIEKGRQEMRQILPQIKRLDRFSYDYALRLKIYPMISYVKKDKNKFRFYKNILAFALPNEVLTLGHRDLDNNKHFTKTITANCLALLSGQSICDSIYKLYVQTIWSLPDILMINRVGAAVKITGYKEPK
jgi:hypothetical protein